MAVDGDGTSAARRRRERRLRSWWTHEQQSVAMALSAATHHSFDKVATEAKYSSLQAQTTDRAEAAYQAPRRPTTRAARETELFQLYEDELKGVRPPPLVEVRPQGQLERHTDVGYELVQDLDVPVLRRVDVADDINDRATLQLLRALAVHPLGSEGIADAASGAVSRRKRKKRRKKLPKISSSHSSSPKRCGVYVGNGALREDASYWIDCWAG